MSFSSQIKNEISRMEFEKDCCILAELAAIVRMNGTIQLQRGNKLLLKMTTENAATARRIFTILRNKYNQEIDVVVKKSKQLKKKNIYLIVISDSELVSRILRDIRFIEGKNILKQNYEIDKQIIKKRCCRRSYIRGSFLGGGSMSNPERSYHLEFTSENEDHAKDLAKIINTFGLNAKVIERKYKYIVYLKEASQIGDILNIIGAHQALLKFEDIRVLKDMRNNVNRLVNCETANLSKTINASMRQVDDIKTIQAHDGLENLPPKLREVAYLRLDNRNASLKELGEMLDPPMGKSGINHRLRKIGQIAEKIRGV